jgi:hypothetical protein
MNGERGAVALAVLWICTLILLMGLQTVVSVRTGTEEAVISFRRSQALYLAAGGAWEALARIAQEQRPPDGEGWLADGVFHLVPYATGSALVALEDETAKMDANTAGLHEMIETLLAAGLDEGRAVAVSEAISGYRDQGRDAGDAEGGKQFQSVDQMLSVPGLPSRLFYPVGPLGPAATDAEVGGIGLFSLFTVHGRSADSEPRPEGEDGSGLYRVVSIGRAESGPPQVVLWMVVRQTPGEFPGYQVLYRKVI